MEDERELIISTMTKIEAMFDKSSYAANPKEQLENIRDEFENLKKYVLPLIKKNKTLPFPPSNVRGAVVGVGLKTPGIRSPRKMPKTVDHLESKLLTPEVMTVAVFPRFIGTYSGIRYVKTDNTAKSKIISSIAKSRISKKNTLNMMCYVYKAK